MQTTVRNVALGIAILAILIATALFIAWIRLSFQPQDSDFYDDFNNPSYDGTYNSSLWILKDGCANAAQSEGVMVFKDTCDLIAGRPTSLIGENLGTFEVRAQVASDHNGGIITQEIDFITYDLPGEIYIKKLYEPTPFIQKVYVSNCAFVGPYHVIDSFKEGKWFIKDHKYEEKEISDNEFVELRKQLKKT